MAQGKPKLLFINYRRKNSQKDANSIITALVAHFGDEFVFQDTTLDPGENWRSEIAGRLREAQIVLSVIGHGWLECSYEETNAKMIFN